MATFFDAHLDLAYLAECGRDLHAGDLAACGGRHLPAAVTFASLREGGVRGCLGTIFTEAVPDAGKPGAETGSFAYPLGDAEAARRAGLRQLAWYERWQREGAIRLVRRGGASGGAVGGVDRSNDGDGDVLRVGILMECADPIASPDDLEFWMHRGVVAVGMAWVHGSRYAAGNGADPEGNAGLTPIGRELVRAMDALGVIHDVSHLSQRATDQLLEMTDATVMASHSNCRGFFDRDAYPNARQRHLTDEVIREIARRGGVIGINLVSDFLEPGLEKGKRASVGWVVRHVERVCELAGHRRAVGLGSDMDGGFSAARLPDGLDAPRDLSRVVVALTREGWSAGDVEGFAVRHWAEFLRI